MAKPPVFDRYTHERQKDLLKAEQDRLDRKDGRAMVGHFLLVVAGVIFLVACLISALR